MGKRSKTMGGLFGFMKTLDRTNLSLAAKKEALLQEFDSESPPPPKKQKVSSETFNATSLVTHYTTEQEVPEHLRKYFAQRYRYFSLYDQGCLLDEEGWYSVTPEAIAEQIAERCRCDTVLDAFCGVGGNAIAFAKTCNRVIALDTSPVRLALARHNAHIYGVADRIEFILADYITFTNSYLSRPSHQRSIDVVFLSPPWGGPSYLLASPTKQPVTDPLENAEDIAEGNSEVQSDYNLCNILPIHGADLFKLTRRITRNVAYFLPRNVNLQEISGLLGDFSNGTSSAMQCEDIVPTQRTLIEASEKIEVEEEYLGGKLKALTCYFGGLVVGQEDLFTST